MQPQLSHISTAADRRTLLSAVPMVLALPHEGAAMFTRSTPGCGTLDGPSLVWAASLWRKLKSSDGSPGLRLPSAEAFQDINWMHFEAFQDINWIALKRHDLLSDRIYQVYSWYIPCKKISLHPAAPHGATKLLMPTPRGRRPPPYPIRVGGPDLWYQMR